YRGTGGYVVGAPSIHPSGRRYSWAEGRTYREALPLVPEGLREIILPPARKDAPVLVAIHTDGYVLSRGAAKAMGREDILTAAAAVGLEVHRHSKGGVVSCPFHHDPGPSMVLYTHDNSFHCFGCEAHGDSQNLL